MTSDMHSIIDKLQKSAIFDKEWYTKKYKGSYSNLIDPIEHFVLAGWKKGFRPSALFDTKWYQMKYPQVRISGINPLLHFLEIGHTKGFKPNYLFDTMWYRNTYRECEKLNIDPLSHFIKEGVFKCAMPHILFDTKWYIDNYKEYIPSDMNPLEHFLFYGEEEGLRPNVLFDTKWYLNKYIEVQISHMGALQHYMQYGVHHDLQPHVFFDAEWYKRKYMTNQSKINPLQHFFEIGISNKFYINPVTDIYSHQKNGSCLREDVSKHILDYEKNDQNKSIINKNFNIHNKIEKTKKAMFVDHAYPKPDQDSGSIDTINYIDALLNLGIDVTFLATTEHFNDCNYRKNLIENGVECIDYYKFRSIEDCILTIGHQYDLIILSRVHAGGNYFEYAKYASPNSKIIFNTVDLHYIRELRDAEINNNHQAITESAWTKNREFDIYMQSDATIVVSSTERDILTSFCANKKIYLVPLLRKISGRKNSFQDRNNIVFIGNFKHKPNIDALLYFFNEIWPLVLKKRSDIDLIIVGPDAPASLLEFSNNNVKFLGHVIDLDDIFNNIRLSIAPLRFGAGAKGKIITSLASGVPCICTKLASEGMDLIPGRGIIVADDAQHFADCIMDIYDNKSKWNLVSDAGLEAVLDSNNVDLCREIFEKIILDLGFDLI